MYYNKLKTLEQLKKNISCYMSTIPNDIRRAAVDNFKKRLKVCFEQNGDHFKHLPV